MTLANVNTITLIAESDYVRKILVLSTILIIFSSMILPLNQIYASTANTQQPIRGIYVTAPATRGPQFNKLLTLVNKSDLNAMVIDIKDDHGNLTFIPSKNSPYYAISRPYITNPRSLLQTLNSNHIYPIARVVVFKDSVLPDSKPNWAFKTPQGIWRNSRGDAFTNPFLKEVWDYNVGIAIEAAKLGFKEIQFDYVRFPEKFEKIEKELFYNKRFLTTNKEATRVTAITEYVKYAREKLKPYNVKLSVDVFGNATVIPEASGIGQNFSNIAQNVDIISAMIYPSHWTAMFNIQKPDLEPFRLVQAYATEEKKRLNKLCNPPISRPWLQDFTASWLGKGNYKVYGKREIEEQIRALHTQGIEEFLLWNGSNRYSPNVDYTPF